VEPENGFGVGGDMNVEAAVCKTVGMGGRAVWAGAIGAIG